MLEGRIRSGHGRLRRWVGSLLLLLAATLPAAPALAGEAGQPALIHTELQRVLSDLKTALRYVGDQLAGSSLALKDAQVTLRTVALGRANDGLRVLIHHPDAPTAALPTHALNLQLDLEHRSRRSGPNLILPAQPLLDLVAAAARAVEDADLATDVKPRAISLDVTFTLAANRGGVTEYQFAPLSADDSSTPPAHFQQKLRLNLVPR